MKQSLLLAFLVHKLNLNPKKLEAILEKYQSLEEAISDNFTKLKSNPKLLDRWQKITDFESEIDRFEASLQKAEVKILTHLDPEYPPKLKDLSDYPLVLYFQGNLELLKNNLAVTVVGSRNFTKYAELSLAKILRPISQAGVNIISGLAIGVDGLSHRLAVENHGPTVGVIGSGLDEANFYPSQHLGLKKEILTKGNLILSEYAPGVPPAPYTFPARNRILAALSPLTLVVQANLKSGSLITAREALEIGRQVATIPGSILDNSFAGNIKLLKDGASLISDSQDVLELLGIQTQAMQSLFEISEKPPEFNSPEEELIYKSLSLEPQNIQLISEKVKLDVNLLGGHLTMLELSGLASNLGENNWIKSG